MGSKSGSKMGSKTGHFSVPKVGVSPRRNAHFHEPGLATEREARQRKELWKQMFLVEMRRRSCGSKWTHIDNTSRSCGCKWARLSLYLNIALVLLFEHHIISRWNIYMSITLFEYRLIRITRYPKIAVFKYCFIWISLCLKIAFSEYRFPHLQKQIRRDLTNLHFFR